MSSRHHATLTGTFSAPLRLARQLFTWPSPKRTPALRPASGNPTATVACENGKAFVLTSRGQAQHHAARQLPVGPRRRAQAEAVFAVTLYEI